MSKNHCPNPYHYEGHASPSRTRTKGQTLLVGVLVIVSAAALCILSGYVGILYANETNRGGGGGNSNTYNVYESNDKGTTANYEKDADGNYTWAGLAQASENSVVRIVAENASTAQRFTSAAPKVGNGIIWSKDGILVTNYHLVKDALQINVRLADGTAVDAALAYSDAILDIAILCVENTELPGTVLGHSSSVVNGEELLMVGNFPGVVDTQEYIRGMVNNRALETDFGVRISVQSTYSFGADQTGGGVFNRRGELVGLVNNQQTVATYNGFNTVTPVDALKDAVEDFLTLGYLTFRVDENLIPLDEIAASALNNWQGGLRVREDVADTPLKRNDTVLAVNDVAICTKKAWYEIIRAKAVGETVTVTYKRGDTEAEFVLTLRSKMPNK